MTWTATNPVAVGNATKKTQYDSLWDNAVYAASIPLRDSSRGLVIIPNASHSDHQMDIDATEVVLQDTDGLCYRATSVNLTVDIAATAGTNALDTGSEAPSTWYYLWVISTGSAEAGLLSASATAPTMPATYTFKALVGAVYNNGSSNFDTMKQVGTTVSIAIGGVAVLDGTQAGSYASVSLAALVPPTAKKVWGWTSVTNSLDGAYTYMNLSIDAAGSGPLQVGATMGAAAGTASFRWELPLQTAQTIYYQITKSGGGTGSGTISVSGWEY